MYYKSINSWGNNSNKSIQMSDRLINGENILMFGNNNSYGDASIPLGNYGYYYENNKNNKILHNDFINSQIELEKFISNTKLNLAGVPGKNNVTIGGAVAADVHGKDCKWAGSFIKNIKSIKLLNYKNQIINCNRNLNSEIFYTTVGGYGLTGPILEVKFTEDLKKRNDFFEMQTRIGKGIKDLISNFSNNKNEYTVGWIDLLSKEFKWVIETSTPVYKHSKISFDNLNTSKDIKLTVPFLGNNYLRSMNMVNNIYYLSKKNKKKKIVKRNKVLYPLGVLSNTKNISSNRKIIQVQFSIPLVFQSELWNLLCLLKYNQKPLLCSIKRLCENETNLNFSFIQDGWTIAVDFPAKDFDHNSIRIFYKKLIELQGKIYLAKDSTINKSEFNEMYSNHTEWRKIVKSIDPNNVFQSELSNRLSIKNW